VKGHLPEVAATREISSSTASPPVEFVSVRQVRRSLIFTAVVTGLLSALLASIVVLPAVLSRNRRRSPERLSDLTFPQFGNLQKGTSTYLSPSNVNATIENGVWKILEDQTWFRIHCLNARTQGNGPGHDVTVTALQGSSPRTLEPTNFICRIDGSAGPNVDCDAKLRLRFRDGQWVALKATSGPAVDEEAEPSCEVHRWAGLR